MDKRNGFYVEIKFRVEESLKPFEGCTPWAATNIRPGWLALISFADQVDPKILFKFTSLTEEVFLNENRANHNQPTNDDWMDRVIFTYQP